MSKDDVLNSSFVLSLFVADVAAGIPNDWQFATKQMVYLDGSMTSEPGLRKQIQEKWPSKQDDVFGVHHLDVFHPKRSPICWSR